MSTWIESRPGGSEVEAFICMDYVSQLRIQKYGSTWVLEAELAYGDKAVKQIVSPFYDDRQKAIDFARQIIRGGSPDYDE